MTNETRSQRECLTGYIVGYQAAWLADIGLKTGLFEGIADARDGVDEADLAARRGLI